MFLCCMFNCVSPLSVFDLHFCLYFRASGAMANASPDLDNAEAQRQLNNNNRPISSGFWETECTSSKLFECSRIKALAGQWSHTQNAQQIQFDCWMFIAYFKSLLYYTSINLTSWIWRLSYLPRFCFKLLNMKFICYLPQMNEMRCRRRLLPSGLTPI